MIERIRETFVEMSRRLRSRLPFVIGGIPHNDLERDVQKGLRRYKDVLDLYETARYLNDPLFTSWVDRHALQGDVEAIRGDYRRAAKQLDEEVKNKEQK